jgi:hypothetical protein
MDTELIKAFQEFKTRKAMSLMGNRMRKGRINIEIPVKYRKHYVVSRYMTWREGTMIKTKKQEASSEATRQEAQKLMQKAVAEGRVSLKTAGIIEERLNAGKISYGQIVKALSTPLKKSQSEPTKEDALNALQEALNEKLITMEEWQTAFDQVRAGKFSPQEAIAACRARAKMNEKPMQKSISSPQNYSGYSFDDIQVRNELLKNHPLAQLLGL